MKWIGLLDCNNFFVSCERLFRPDLHGKPVVVLSSNDGCVVARSQEVKDMGIPMGVPYFKIKDTLKNNGATVFSSHFALYRDVSRRVFEVMREELDVVEQYSIDEAFFTLVSNDPVVQAKALKQRVEQVVGIPVSVGIASTKTQAKYANTLAKKGSGVYWYTAEQWRKAAADIFLKDIWGVGGKLELLYKQHHLYTVADLLQADVASVAQLFGVAGVRLRAELSGVVVQDLEHLREPQKSVMCSRSFKQAVTDIEVIFDAVAYHARHAAADVRGMNMLANIIRVTVLPSRHGDFMLRGGSVEAILPTPTNDTITIVRTANELVESLYEAGVPYKKAGVVLSGLLPVESQQTSLFVAENQAAAETAEMMKVIDGINRCAPKELVQIGTRFQQQSWTSRIEARSPAYTTNWAQIASVKAKDR